MRERKWIPIVLLPTLVLALYYGLFASPQYESEAHFMVRSAQGNSQPVLGQAISLLGNASNSSSDTASVSDYLTSHDVVDALRKQEDLVGIYRRPGTDIFSRLSTANPSPERLLKYFQDHSSVKVDSDSGISVIRVRSFRPEDSFRLTNALLALGEHRINILNQRAYDSTLRMARRQLAEAEDVVSSTQAAMTRFRQGRRNIDPVATGQAQITVVSNLQAILAQTRAQRAAMLGAVRSNSPQVQAMDARIAALQAQVNTESARLAGSSTAIAANVGDYQGLQVRQQFAVKRYDDAAASLQKAREQAIRQQLFIVRVVEPNMPVKALYPKGTKVVLTAFVGLLLAYACGWLIAAGVREHAA